MREHEVIGGGGTPLRVMEGGNHHGPSVLFIHGLSQCWLCWSRQFESSLAEDLHLVAMDIRGHGGSGKPRDAYGESRLWADDVAAVISNLGLSYPLLVGWSYAGLIICDYLRSFGDEAIAGVNFVGCITKMSEALAPRLFAGEFLELIPGFLSNDVEESVPSLVNLIDISSHSGSDWWGRSLALGYNALVPPYVRRGLLSRALENDDLLGSLSKPVLVSQGASDRIVRPGVANDIIALIPGARLSVYPSAGHALFLDEPGRFNQELLAFARICQSGAQ